MTTSSLSRTFHSTLNFSLERTVHNFCTHWLSSWMATKDFSFLAFPSFPIFAPLDRVTYRTRCDPNIMHMTSIHGCLISSEHRPGQISAAPGDCRSVPSFPEYHLPPVLRVVLNDVMSIADSCLAVVFVFGWHTVRRPMCFIACWFTTASEWIQGKASDVVFWEYSVFLSFIRVPNIGALKWVGLPGCTSPFIQKSKSKKQILETG